MNKEIGGRISIELKKKNISQKQLAERINLSETVVSRYISGEREPKANVLANIATALNTTSDYLLGIEEDDFDHPRIKRMLARNANKMSKEEKRELIDALFGEE
ncbi:MAG: helix-turn-helix domain-containing protein [Lactobacillus iners]|uniref:helix-turn-helix domain-containing protein n=1 Tax=Lactobacillus iners TaxID=147802 RepID=UPI001F09CCC2|nr:helix-turn-helix transcriptional regulator [Lactobacillus iners]MCT7671628.1 helix-turn-helix domain-containing protein [Lactobacillus iners]MCT7682819.1 helix-turn-helix domain-containing protein [Lactobacillus iners]MCT7734122.1 helix-turn-helix domain-containing protein [Lactobacillus iners]MCT7781539.1 helix-turn-helix domain-containing protein [Lactobacillus iners]MCT7810145.1 helix-turn-helix domain-containing protein [Lactobacillus iners]